MILRLAQRLVRERRWGEESVVFNTYSGETHHLNALASAIYRRVSAARAIDVDALCAALAGDGGDAPEISLETIGGAAASLRRIGLIQVDDSES